MEFRIFESAKTVYNSLDKLNEVAKSLGEKEGYYKIYFYMTEDFNWKKFTAVFPELPDNVYVEIYGRLKNSDLYAMCFSGGVYDINESINTSRIYLTKKAAVTLTIYNKVPITVFCYNESKLDVLNMQSPHIKAYNNSIVISKDSGSIWAFDKSLIKTFDGNWIYPYDESSVEASNCRIYPYSDRVALKTQRCAININKDRLLNPYKHTLPTKGLYIYDKESLICMDFPFEIETLISEGGTEIISIDCYLDNDYNGMYRDPRKYISPNRVYYKCVYKKDDRYYSFYDEDYEYRVGELAIPDDYNSDPEQICGQGIHVATIEWALDNYFTSADCAILEVRVPEDAELVAPYRSDGKLRASKVEILREVSLDELGELGKFYKKFAKIED